MIYAALVLVALVVGACLFALDRMVRRVEAAHSAVQAMFQRQLDETQNRLAAAQQGLVYLTPSQTPAPDPHAGQELWADDTGLIEAWLPAEDTDG